MVRKGEQRIMKLTDSKYKNQIGEYFDYSMEWDFLDIIANVLERIDLEELDDDNCEDNVAQAIDEELIYTADQWTVIQHYQTPNYANLDMATMCLQEDITCLIKKIAG